MATLLHVIQGIGGIFLILFAVAARSKGEPRWVQLGWLLTGVFTELHIVFSRYLHGLWLVRDARYWVYLSRRCALDGVIIGMLIILLFWYFDEQPWKRRTARSPE